jgi:hypothetical protein
MNELPEIINEVCLKSICSSQLGCRGYFDWSKRNCSQCGSKIDSRWRQTHTLGEQAVVNHHGAPDRRTPEQYLIWGLALDRSPTSGQRLVSCIVACFVMLRRRTIMNAVVSS